jgi:hypothetical protein
MPEQQPDVKLDVLAEGRRLLEAAAAEPSGTYRAREAFEDWMVDNAEALLDCAALLKEFRQALARERGGGSPLDRAAYIELHQAAGDALARLRKEAPGGEQ